MAAVLRPRVIESPAELGRLRDEWDALAVQSERPFAAPAWGLSWWEHLRPRRAELRLLFALDEGGAAVGVAPMYCAQRAYAPLGGGMAPVEPLARPGAERQVAEAVRAALIGATPRAATVEVEAHGSSPDWAGLLGDGWGDGSGAWRWAKLDAPAPQIDLGSGFEQWLAARSKTFRREMNRKRRKLEEAGGSFRFATADSLQRDVATFLRLHRARLAGQGGSSLSGDGVERMLVAVGRELHAAERFRLLCIELEGETIAAQVLLAAGREVSAWNSGFDESRAKLSPAMLCVMESLRYASERGERTMSLGSGGQDYKYRLSNGEDSLSSHVLVPPGASYPLARLRLLPLQLRKGLAKRLSHDAKLRLRALVRR